MKFPVDKLELHPILFKFFCIKSNKKNLMGHVRRRKNFCDGDKNVCMKGLKCINKESNEF